MIMSFNNYYIDNGDYKFFSSLPEDEKIYFLYDLVCTNFYGAGSITDLYGVVPNTMDINAESTRVVISSILDQSIDKEARVNVIFLNDLIVFNSESKQFLNYALIDLAFDGVFLKKLNVPENIEDTFKKQSHYEVYKILGVSKNSLI